MTMTDFQARARHVKATKLARVILHGLDTDPPSQPADWADAPREIRERVRVLAGVKAPSDGTLGVSDATWAEAVAEAGRMAEGR